jgi:hypothetical protein
VYFDDFYDERNLAPLIRRYLQLQRRAKDAARDA